jgi:hypothetical protein
MTEQRVKSESEFAPEVPSKNLPPMRYKDMPEPLPLRKVIGPSLILTGLAISSGEYILWPYITAEAGLTLLWLAVVGVTIQFFLNMEIERWTLATGETAIAGFVRLWKPWGLVMAISAFITVVWPGWATSGATTLGFAFGLEPSSSKWIAIVALLAIAITLTASPVVYKTVEKLESFKVIVTLLFLIIAIVFAVSARAWGELDVAVMSIGTGLGDLPGNLNPTVVLGALAFAGAGALSNLAQSNWIRDKGYGMGIHIPRIASPVTGEDVAQASVGSMMRQDDVNLKRFRGWWRVANIEQLVTFWAMTILSIFVLSMMAYSTIYGKDLPGAGNLVFIEGMGDVLKETVGPWFGVLFWVVGGFGLMLSALANVDYVSRVIADVLKTVYLQKSTRWTESRIYFLCVWGLVVVGSTILLAGFDQPLTLLVVSAVLGGVIMFVYTGLLIRLNRTALPTPIRLKGFRLAAMIVAVLFYGYFSVRMAGAYAVQFFG